MLRQPFEANPGFAQQPQVRLVFVPESDLKLPGVKSQNNLTNIKALRVDIVRVNQGQEQHADFIHVQS